MKVLSIAAAGMLLTATAAHAQSWGYGVNGFAQGLAQGLAITSGEPYRPPPPVYYPAASGYGTCSLTYFLGGIFCPPNAPRQQRCTGYTDIAGVSHVNCY